MRRRDEELRTELQKLYKDAGASADTATQLAAWNPYDQNQSAPFFDPEWMFEITGGFDVVIGNPPYISIANLPSTLISDLSEQKYNTFARNADLYCLFYERGMNILRPKGIFTYISSNRFCFTNYGSGLRDYLSKKNILQIINFNEINVFESANVGSVVLLIQNSKPDKTPVLIYEAKGDDAISKIRIEKKYSDKEYYQANQWSFDENHLQMLKKKIESVGVPFIQWRGITINRGVTTGANHIFIIDEDKRQELIMEHPSSEEILLPVLKGANIKRYHINDASHYLIFSYRGIDILEYPAVYNYLLKYRTELEEVYEAKHGQKQWYELRNCSYYDKFSMKKLIWTRLSNQNTFSISTAGEFTVDSTSFAVGSNLEYLLAVLNSKTVYFYFKLGSVIWGKNGIKWFGSYFDNIPIPDISEIKQSQFVKLVDTIIDKKNQSIDTSTLETEIDHLVYGLYGLTEEEIAIVEGRTT